ncbi:hypothetical protein AYO21_05378 [Fonsecaea monophora]|uniref:Uncharacterized protein n=1 Tax=Fonsecaea monophora TaxID=254056 RepID=A0A177F8A1_9EURO|nr:hypothetical protein AYO21_05378 [Fonsecaea monophora]OAG40478.1 hypothetical protein AYO21_05378 [Fonsecaea monophora]
MDEDQIWLSEEEEEEEGNSVGPTFFSLALTLQDQPGGYHVRNRPGQRQRAAVSVIRGGSGRKPVFTVSCNAKVMIHGTMGPSTQKPATLLVYEFKFNSYRGKRIKEADITFEFRPREGKPGGPSVKHVWPQGLYKMEETTQKDTSEWGAGIAPKFAAIDPGVNMTWKGSIDKESKHHTVVSGDNPQDPDWGDFFQARFFLSENKSQSSGIPNKFTACILLQRPDDADFECVPYITVTPAFSTMVASLFSNRPPDDPIVFSIGEDPVNETDPSVEIVRENLAATQFEKLWGCTLYTQYDEAVKGRK